MATVRMNELSSDAFPVHGFDYQSVRESDRQLVQDTTSRIRKLMNNAAQQMLELGMLFSEVRAALDSAQWHAWCRYEIGIKARLANTYMQAAETFGGEPGAENLGKAAITLLMTNKVSQAARDEALSIARSGQLVPQIVAREIIKRHRTDADRVQDVPYEIEKFQRTLRRALTTLVDALPETDDKASGHVVRQAMKDVLAEFGLVKDNTEFEKPGLARKLGLSAAAPAQRRRQN